MKRMLMGLAAAGLMAVAPVGGEDNLDVLINKVKPTPQEVLWKQIPWVKGVKEAKDLAAKTGKPIFIFRVDGDFESGRC